MTNQEAFKNTKQILLKLYDSDEAKSICSLLFETIFGLSSQKMILDSQKVFLQLESLEKIQTRLLNYEPIQHIIGVESFCGLKIKVNSDVLIPRPETEELIQLVIKEFGDKDITIADVCTGSGCIALAIRNLASQSKIIATDISEKAILKAKESEVFNFKSNTIIWEIHDILNQSWSYEWPDLVICNPPYIELSEKEMMTENVLNFEPELALFVFDSDPLLFYKKVLHVFSDGIFPIVFFELNPNYAEALKHWSESKGYVCELIFDMFEKRRFAKIYR